jgi:hypothetical protein
MHSDKTLTIILLSLLLGVLGTLYGLEKYHSLSAKPTSPGSAFLPSTSPLPSEATVSR